VQGEWGVSALIRSNASWAAAGLGRLAVSNDEGDPMVGWETPEDWRGDARYGAIIPKMVNQHLLAIHDNATANNPLGWLSFDGAFMNGVGDNYTGFGERTMTARFGGPFQGASPFAFVRKNGLAAFHLLSLLPDTRCAVSAPAARAPLRDNFGALAAFDAAGGGDLAVLVYNSPDCGSDAAPAVAPAITVAASALAPTAADGTVLAVPFALDDDPRRSTAAAWAALGSPALPTAAQLAALWAAGAGMGAPAGPPVAVAVGARGDFALPNDTAVPLPGVLLWYVADKRGAPAPPPAPSAPEALLKAKNASLCNDVAREVLLRWDCADTARSVVAYDIQFSPGGAGGPWSTVNAPPFPQDALCSFSHAVAEGAVGGAYRLAATDLWGRKGAYSEPVPTKPWPLWPEERR
jgi:L-iduronidase